LATQLDPVYCER